jgi:hypothetical protein
MRSRGWLEITMIGSSSWMPCAPQGVKGIEDDNNYSYMYQPNRRAIFRLIFE